MTTAEAYTDVIRFHGHECPGAALGVRIAQAALAHLGRHGEGNELIALSETNTCGIDAVQVLTGCTLGKRNLQSENTGKNAFTFWRRRDGAAIRIMARAGSDAYRDELTWSLSEKIEGGAATASERTRFSDRQRARIQRILAAPEDELLVVATTGRNAPDREALRPSEPCGNCAEPTSVAILHDHRGTMMCPPCHRDAHGGSVPAGPGPGDHAHSHGHPNAHAHAQINAHTHTH